MSRARTNADQARTESLSVVPHIIPDVLYPAVAGKLLDGSTSHGATYGVAQADGRSYYYTDIKGSKPIKDPRIGSHFGSQRHTVRSIQLQEQETATHGINVFNVDGREWFRYVSSGTMDQIKNDSAGHYLEVVDSGDFIEVTGYFSDMNLKLFSGGAYDAYTMYLDGASGVAKTNPATIASPLGSRFVDISSVFNVAVGTTIGIHTVKILRSDPMYLYGIELIAQDTTSTATKSQIQIPSQNVVSYGKKFTVSGTPHYDPFNGFTSGSSVTAYVDTATSLGVEGWKNSSTYYRPYNGGRVVKWVDSSGVIKTSVNMMPPNARSIGNSASLTNATAKANASIANNTFYPTMEAGTIDHSQAEVAKTFMCYEYGNGGANGGTAGTYRDFSTDDASGEDTLAYVMDDGLTSLSLSGGRQNGLGGGFYTYADDSFYMTFIGTGISVYSTLLSASQNIAQNLPYGTHILRMYATASHQTVVLTIDGVQVNSGTSFFNYNQIKDITYHQPKMPPIPEDAVVIADYMLMADYVKSTDGGIKISKGIRLVSATRDCFHDTSVTFNTLSINPTSYIPFGFTGINTLTDAADTACKLPSFGTHGEIRSYANRGDLFVDDVDVAGTGSGSTYTAIITQDTASTLGLHTFESRSTTNTNHIIQAIGVATPIHTSSHYQTFETPFLHELVGGDRNMEQNNLVVTPDGKTWDEVTRDVGYIGNMSMRTTVDHNTTAINTAIIHDEWRGVYNAAEINTANFNKDFAIAYDRVICLRDGEYSITYAAHISQNAAASGFGKIRVNNTSIAQLYQPDANWSAFFLTATTRLKRGDYVQLTGQSETTNNFFEINRVS